MGAMIEIDGIETGEFFAPSCTDMIDGMIGQYRQMRAKIEQVVGLFDGDLGNVGRLVAVLPASMREKVVLPGFVITWSSIFSNEFAGTSVSVAIMKAEAL